MEGIRLSIRYSLTALRPTPERLRQLVAGFARSGYSEVYIDWCDSFPWGLDKRFSAFDAYREDFVSGLVREAGERGTVLNTVFPAPDALGFAARVGSYRRLFRGESTGPILDLRTPAGRSFYAELIDDYLRLLPEAAAILVDCRPRAVAPTLLARAMEPFRAQGLRIGVSYTGTPEGLGRNLPLLVDGFDFVALPMSDAFSRSRSGSMVAVVSTPAELDALHEVVSAGPGDANPPLLMSFQSGRPPGESGEAGAAGGVLGESIERWLPEVRRAAGALGVATRGDSPSAGFGSDASEPVGGLAETDRRLGRAIAEGWDFVRLVREELRGGDAEVPPKILLVSLAAAYRTAVDLSQELRRLLEGVVDSYRLDRALGRMLGALFEEHLDLCGRAGVVVPLDPPESSGHGRRLETDPFSC